MKHKTDMPRRSFMRLAGTSAVVLAAVSATGLGGFAATRTPTKALAPWERAGKGYNDPRMQALSYAILAPNPHNRQPWIADLRREGEIILRCDLDRLLPETDPFDRQILIGLGCFLEILRMAAAKDGYRVQIDRFPEGMPETNLDQRPIARIYFLKETGIAPDPLFDFVMERRSNKEPYNTDMEVSNGSLHMLQKVAGDGVTVGVENNMAAVAQLRDLTWRAFEIEIRTERTYQESIDLMRIGKAEIEENPDGLDLGGPLLEGLNKLGILTRERIADPNDPAFQQGLDMYRPITGTAMAYIWVATQDNGRLGQLDVGRAWLRINLKATEMGLGIHPLSQALQEYTEMAEIFKETHQKLGIQTPGRVQMFGRLGYGQEIDPSPRWPLEKKIIKA